MTIRREFDHREKDQPSRGAFEEACEPSAIGCQCLWTAYVRTIVGKSNYAHICCQLLPTLVGDILVAYVRCQPVADGKPMTHEPRVRH